MNRADRRRQSKKSGIPKSAPGPAPERARPSVRDALQNALQHHAAGRLAEAEDIYRRILHVDPDQPQAMHLLGVVAHQSGSNEAAVDLITRAIARQPDMAAAHSNLGKALRELGRPDEAVRSCREAIALNADFAEAHNNLGNALGDLDRHEEAVAAYRDAIAARPDYAEAQSNLGSALREMGRLDDAVASYRRALATKPDFAGAHSNLGNALRDLGRLDDAVVCYRTAVTIQPNYAQAHNNMGNALRDLGKLREAIASYRQALSHQPSLAEAHSSLGNALQDQGMAAEALQCHRRAVALDPENEIFWSSFAGCLEMRAVSTVDDRLLDDLLRLLDRPTVRPSGVVRQVVAALCQHPAFAEMLALTRSAEPGATFDCLGAIEKLSEIPLLLRIMALSPIPDLRIEDMLATLRRTILEETLVPGPVEGGLPFLTSLALQRFTNEYVYAETDRESANVERLQQHVFRALEQERDIAPSTIAVLGAYRPLFALPVARQLAERTWPDLLQRVIARQVIEPLHERSLASGLDALTPIEDDVSRTVRAQYEANPYPRWVNAGLSAKQGTIGAVLRAAPLRLALADYVPPARPEILVAGCGTGQQALGTASSFLNARVLAVDLSLSSLSYALRRTQELGLSNIEYAQADIMALGDLERRFDLIECVGVLHHLGDPLAGWRVLADLLRPGGLMKLGLYSETARLDVVAGRRWIAEAGYQSTAEGIRRCRQDIVARAAAGDKNAVSLCSAGDFYSLSECRDLLFHVQEHRFTLPQIESALGSLGLAFLGFGGARTATLAKFNERFADRADPTSLSQWHAFELDSPDTFQGMYQFWCRKL